MSIYYVTGTVPGGRTVNKTFPAPETNNKQHIHDIGWFSVLWRKATQAKGGREYRVLLFIALLYR